MNEVREYRIPLLMGAATLVVALLVWAILISPQNSKLSALQTQQTTLQSQQTTLEAKLASLKSEQQKLSSSCADLQKISTQIPSVQSPTDVDAEESSFENQFNGLVAGSGVALTQFSGFSPATTAQTAPASGSTGSAPSGVVAVPTTLAVTGNYGQISTFINDLDGFPRLFVIQSFVLTYGSTAPGATSSAASGSNTASASSAASPPLWTGGAPTPASAGPYSLAIDGSIYYTSTPSALDACTKATAAVH
jgi:Tfp pilus assembly protein PilO